MTRPQLPVKYANPKIKRIVELNSPPQVKYQMLSCQGREILVGRLKVETPTENGHAFILRRFDTGAVSLTTMFRAAFPLASDMEERAELQWVKDNHDLSGNNGSNKESHITRLAGTWVSPTLAVELGDQYALAPLIKIVVDAQPDPNANYKRSAKAAAAASASAADVSQVAAHSTTISQQASTTSITANGGSMYTAAPTPRGSSIASSRATVGSLPTPSPTSLQPNPPKRRKESSPAPQAAESTSPINTKTPLRRSNRPKSPGSKPVSASTPARPSKKRVEQLTPASDKSMVDEDGDKVQAVAAKELHDQDIHEQKILIETLKAQRDAAEKEKAERPQEAQEEDNEEIEEQEEEDEPSVSKKRTREEGEPEYQFEFREPEVGDREIATNRRIGFPREPRARSFAWGIAAFAVGMGAISFLPNLL
ncbi:hypothetical protein P691DRAFT_810537 [Macrolepiota fuliginosa MF-IS2]|uniref:HTH APSES-type domain-containing protein n=1 Tax=Macrolepiota fuliginosa MF-IS2 TaxID=1400762 RepID=A0A9P5XFC6_9AGAR|nr:hypothetical protein P691DRAFT_810537 [Macrolepiota fuliginosa MF-IS2]